MRTDAADHHGHAWKIRKIIRQPGAVERSFTSRVARVATSRITHLAALKDSNQRNCRWVFKGHPVTGQSNRNFPHSCTEA